MGRDGEIDRICIYTKAKGKGMGIGRKNGCGRKGKREKSGQNADRR